MELIDILNKYWGIILTVCGVIASYATLKYQNNEQQKDIDNYKEWKKDVDKIIAERSGYGAKILALEEENCRIKTTQQSIDTRLAQIQTDLEWIKQALKK